MFALGSAPHNKIDIILQATSNERFANIFKGFPTGYLPEIQPKVLLLSKTDIFASNFCF